MHECPNAVFVWATYASSSGGSRPDLLHLALSHGQAAQVSGSTNAILSLRVLL